MDIIKNRQPTISTAVFSISAARTKLGLSIFHIVVCRLDDSGIKPLVSCLVDDPVS